MDKVFLPHQTVTVMIMLANWFYSSKWLKADFEIDFSYQSYQTQSGSPLVDEVEESRTFADPT